MHLAAAGADMVPDGGDDARELVGADVRMGFIEDALIRPELHQQAEDPVHITSFVGSCVELPVAVGAGPAFAETIVAVRVDGALPVEQGQVPPPFPDILPPLQKDGPDPKFQQLQGREQPGRSGADDGHPSPGPVHIL